MPGAVAPAASCAGNAQSNAHEFSAGTTEHTPAPPAQWFSAYTRSPRSTGLVSLRRRADHGVSIPKGRHRHSTRLDASVGAPGPRDFAVRALIARLAIPARPPHPVPTSAAIGQTPLQVESGCGERGIFFGKPEEIIFGSKAEISNYLESVREIGFLRSRFWRGGLGEHGVRVRISPGAPLTSSSAPNMPSAQKKQCFLIRQDAVDHLEIEALRRQRRCAVTVQSSCLPS